MGACGSLSNSAWRPYWLSEYEQGHPPVQSELVDAAQRVASQICRDSLSLSPIAPDIKDFSIFQTVDESDIEDVMRLARLDIRAQRAMGAMVGMAVADSVGCLFEFLPVGALGSSFDAKTLQATGVYNKFRLKPGQWTDDTSMGLCIADSLLVCDGYDGTDTRVRFWNWWNRGYNNTFRRDSERSASVGLGGNISLSLMLMPQSKVVRPRYEGLGEDAGNGSVMRLSPVPIFFHQDIDLAMRVSAESSYTTHPGPSAADACAFLGFVVCKAITRNRRRMTASQFLDAVASEYLSRPEAQAQPSLLKLLRSSESFGSKEHCWNWKDPKGPYLLETIAARGKFYNGYPVLRDYFGSYSMDGLAIALHSMYHTTSFMGAVTRCINFLGDADSTGAICGQIAGAFYGVDAIDDRLVAKLRRWDDGYIALRGAMLYVLGSEMSEKTRQAAWNCSRNALLLDRRKNESEKESAIGPPLPDDLLLRKGVAGGGPPASKKCPLLYNRSRTF